MKKLFVVAVMIATIMFSQDSVAENLIKDPGFESPVVPSGSALPVVPGQIVGNWIAVASNYGCDMGLFSTSFSRGGVTFNAHSGKQWFSLGAEQPDGSQCYSSSVSGIEQTVATTPGTQYTLSFWLGSGNAGQGVGLAQMSVYINGVLLVAAVEPPAVSTTSIQWGKFTATFTASHSSTTILFLPPVYLPNVVGLDDVQLQ